MNEEITITEKEVKERHPRTITRFDILVSLSNCEPIAARLRRMADVFAHLEDPGMASFLKNCSKDTDLLKTMGESRGLDSRTKTDICLKCERTL